MTQENNKLEARQWLKNNPNKSAVATNRFGTSENALEFIEMLYQAGAIEITIDGIREEESRIASEGGPYAELLVIKLPSDFEKRTMLFEIAAKESEEEGFEPEIDSGQDSIKLWWD